MAKESSKQRLANLIQAYEQVVSAARSLYDDDSLKSWAIDYSNDAKNKITCIEKKVDQFDGSVTYYIPGMPMQKK